MKKLLAGLFILSFLVIGASQAHASTLSDALAKIKSLESEILSLKTKLGASAVRAIAPAVRTTVEPTTSVDTKIATDTEVSTTTTTEVKTPVCRSMTKPGASFCPNGTIQTVKDANSCISYKCTSYTPTLPAASITVDYPTGGEVFNSGDKITVKWSSNNIVAKVVGIMLVDAKSVQRSQLEIYPTDNDGFETITIPSDIPAGINYRIFISNDQTGGAYSNYFTINSSDTKTPSITVLSPNGGETFVQGQFKNKISWSGGKNKVQIGLFKKTNSTYSGYSTRSGIIGWIELDGKPNSSLIWDGITLKSLDGNIISAPDPYTDYSIVAVTESNEGNYCLKVYDSSPCSSDISDSTFTITDKDTTTPPITVLSPNGGEVYKAGDPIKVTWISVGLPDNAMAGVSLEDTKGANTYYLLDTYCSSSSCVSIHNGSLTVKIPNDISSGLYKVRLFCGAPKSEASCITDSIVEDRSDNYFTITNKNTAVTKTNPDIKINTTRTLKVGTTGEDVKALQSFLGLTPDGAFGKNTKTKVIEWQKANGLTPDGTFGNMSKVKAGI